MQAFLKSHRGYKNKQFLGVIGVYLIEILDGDSFIPKFLEITGSNYVHVPSGASRFLSPDERMILRSFDSDCMIIFKSSSHDPERYVCSIDLFICQHKSNRIFFLVDALRLASYRWSKISVAGKLYPLTNSLKQPAAEIQEALLSPKSL